MSDIPEKIFAVECGWGSEPKIQEARVQKWTAEWVTLIGHGGLAFGCKKRISVAEAYVTPGEAWAAFVTERQKQARDMREKADRIEEQARLAMKKLREIAGPVQAA
jgi:hypothetical protein